MDTPTPSLAKYQMFIGGEWTDAASGATFESHNPYTGKPWALIPKAGPDDSIARCARRKGFHRRRLAEVERHQRGALLRKLGDLIGPNARRLAEIEVVTTASSSPKWACRPRTWRVVLLLRRPRGQDRRRRAAIDKADTFNYTKHEPLGVVAALTPWNSPLLLTAWKLAPALAAGNTVVIKPSEFTSASVLEFMKLVQEAGFPPGVVNVVTGFGPDTGAPLVEHPLVAKITFTGSDATGQKIYEAAARGLKRVSLELGGKSPNIVFADADLDNAVKGAISGIFAATGQTCIAGSRLLSSARSTTLRRKPSLREDPEDGRPDLAETQVGPITTSPNTRSARLHRTRQRQAQRRVGGGKPLSSAMWFVQPTIFRVKTRCASRRMKSSAGSLGIVRDTKRRSRSATRGDGLAGRLDEDMGRALKMRTNSGWHGLDQHLSRGGFIRLSRYKRSASARERPGLIKALLRRKACGFDGDEVPNPFVMKYLLVSLRGTRTLRQSSGRFASRGDLDFEVESLRAQPALDLVDSFTPAVATVPAARGAARDPCSYARCALFGYPEAGDDNGGQWGRSSRGHTRSSSIRRRSHRRRVFGNGTAATGSTRLISTNRSCTGRVSSALRSPRESSMHGLAPAARVYRRLRNIDRVAAPLASSLVARWPKTALAVRLVAAGAGVFMDSTRSSPHGGVPRLRDGSVTGFRDRRRRGMEKPCTRDAPNPRGRPLAARVSRLPRTASRRSLLDVVPGAAAESSHRSGERWAIEHVLEALSLLRGIQSAVPQLVAFRGPRPLSRDDIGQIRVGVSAYSAAQNGDVSPTDLMGAQFSIPYALRSLLMGDPVTRLCCRACARHPSRRESPAHETSSTAKESAYRNTTSRASSLSRGRQRRCVPCSIRTASGARPEPIAGQFHRLLPRRAAGRARKSEM